MHLSAIVMAVTLLSVTLVNGDNEKLSNYYTDLKHARQFKFKASPSQSSQFKFKVDTDKEDDSAGCSLKVECKNKKGEPGIKGSTGGPGFPGMDGLDGRPGSTGVEGIKGEPGQSGLPETPASFFVALDENMGPLDGQVLKYPHLFVNQGSAYNLSTGIFTAPSDGIYVFNVVVSAQEKKTAAVKLYHNLDGNEVWVTTVWAESLPNWATSSNTVYLPLTAGQQVYLRARQNMNSYYYGGIYTNFSGHMVSRRT